ncbi:hypothetical protein OH492_14550 [Vibrio chagasii]|nr:hypothetical protein [Vibrio chagasii]
MFHQVPMLTFHWLQSLTWFGELDSRHEPVTSWRCRVNTGRTTALIIITLLQTGFEQLISASRRAEMEVGKRYSLRVPRALWEDEVWITSTTQLAQPKCSSLI